ncbi:FAD-dependent monooxygenase [Luteolibacter flavescens]|uniref:FAD-dependent monooxygenase n=1 Tax=Luteolibacter flavescens TaxID=1859460 RepID=A0ABT3FKX9_9BACT|nr:NAD(P)/FAD-dependent oxidoreductase [Luteolibacter flavescens]MCW1884107.1 FAD-dependent monooxygenase [Luteolibacter flavescens]
MNPKLRVAVVGCGSAGPAAAILLRRQGHEVTLYERAPDCRPVGAGFLLQPSGMAVLRELGILEEILRRGARVERLHVVDRDEREVLDLHYAELGKDLHGLGLHRPVLLHFLLEAMRDAGVDVRWGWEISQARREDGKWLLETADGRRETGYDLLVVADGARSALRGKLGFKGINRGYPWGAHWFIGENRGAFPESELYQIVHGTRRLLGFLATGTELDGTEPLVSLFWSIKLADDATIRARPLAEWKQTILDLCPRADALLGQIHDWSQVLTARYGDVAMSRWHGDGVVILGDAGHAMSPQLGQGVNLALADAACLADSITRFPDLTEALSRYSRERRMALAYYRLASRQLTPWFQSDHEWLTPLRTGFFGITRHLPLARRFMTKTMAGLVGASLPRK